MTFGLDAPQRSQQKRAYEFAQQDLNDDVVERDHDSLFSPALWRACAAFGVLGWAAPEDLGGSGLDYVTVVGMMEGLGRGCRDNGLAFGLGTQIWSVQHALSLFGTDMQKARYLPKSIAGEWIGAFAMNEAGSGSAGFELACSAEKTPTHYILNGEKSLVAFAPIADFAIIFANTNPQAGQWGISAFVVDASTSGYASQPADRMMGLRTVPIGKITLTDCHVPHSALIGKEGSGAAIFNRLLGLERGLILAPQIGAMQRQLDDTVKFARRHKRKGQSIGKHQAVSHRIADMKLRLELARLILYKTAWLEQNNQSSLMESALAKLHISEAFSASSLDAIAIHGGRGYQTEFGIERDLRDALGGTIYAGTTDIQRNIVAGLLRL